MDMMMIAAGGAGIACGFLLSNMLLKLSDRFKGLISTAFGGGTAKGVDWGTWGGWLLAVVIWLLITGWGVHMTRKAAKGGAPASALHYGIAGVGIGGLLEELTAMPV